MAPTSIALTATRRSVGVWAFPLLAAAELMNAFARDRIWAIEWQWTAYWSNTATYVVVPLAAAIAVGESVLYRRRGVADLLRSRRERLRGQAGRVLALGAWVVAAHVVGIVACGASAALVHRSWHLPWWPVLPAVGAVLAAVLVGAAIGWWWPSLAAPPLVGLAWLALLVIGVSARLDLYLRVDNATGDTHGLRPRVGFTLAATVWWCAVALAALWVLVHRAALEPVDLVVPVLVLAAATVLHQEGSRPFVLVHRALPPVCSNTRPVLCVDQDYRPRLAAYALTLEVLAGPLTALDPTAVPARFEQAGPRLAGSPPVSGVGAVGIVPSGAPDATFLALDLAKTASRCAAAPTSGTGPLWAAETRLADWLLTTTGLRDDLFIRTDRITSSEQARQALQAMRAAC